MDYTLLFDGDTLSMLIRTLRPHIHIMGAEYAGQLSPTADALQEIGERGSLHRKFGRLHTSAIIEHILALALGA